jgi:putative transcriptional regulator
MVNIGTLIIASPEIAGGLYAKSVILICEHSQEGTIGVMINKPLPTQTDEEKNAIEKLEDHQIMTLLGGPIHPDEAFMLHNNPKLKEESVILNDDVYLGSLLPLDPDDSTHNMRLIFGYSGWGPNQLEKEIAKGLWIEAGNEAKKVFLQPIEEQWHLILKTLGGKFQALASFPTRLDLN